jgi:sarcosine oxidase subunit gamma
VIAEATRRSPLADYAERFTALYKSSNGVISIQELPFLTQINLRVDPRETAIMPILADILSFALPLTPNTIASTGDRRALWLGPDEWLVVGDQDHGKTIEQSLRDVLAGAAASVADVSAGRTAVLIRGGQAQGLLAYGIPIDLHPRVFVPGRCAQTLLAKAPVIIERSSEDAFHLYVRSSYANYVAGWLLDAATAPLRPSARSA